MFRSKQFSVKRRFSDFLGLYEKLSEKHAQNGFIVPPPPEKSLIGERWRSRAPGLVLLVASSSKLREAVERGGVGEIQVLWLGQDFKFPSSSCCGEVWLLV